MTATTAATTAAATAIRRGVVIIIITAIFAVLSSESKRGEQAAHLLAVTLCADHIVGVLVADQQFKFGFAA